MMGDGDSVAFDFMPIRFLIVHLGQTTACLLHEC